MSSNPPDGFGPILAPLTRALALRHYMENLSYEKEQREQQRQLFRLHLDQAQHDRVTQDMHSALALHASGFVPETPQSEAQQAGAEKLFGPAQPGYERPEIAGPSGQKYRAPSRQDLMKRQVEEAAATGKARGVERSTEQGVLEEEGRKSGSLVQVPKPFELGGTLGEKMWIDRKEIPALLKAQKELKGRKWSKTEFKTDPQTGKTVFFGVDADTGETVEKEMTARMTPKAEKASKTGMSKEAHAAMLKAQDAINDAQSDTGKMAKEGLTDAQKMERSNTAVDQAVEAYPDELESYTDAQGAHKIKRKSGAGVAQASSNGKPAGQGQRKQATKTVRSSQFEQILQHEDVKRRGIKDVNALRKDLAKHGYTIIED